MKLDTMELFERPSGGVLKKSPHVQNLEIRNFVQDVIDRSCHGDLEFALTIRVFLSLHKHKFCETLGLLNSRIPSSRWTFR